MLDDLEEMHDKYIREINEKKNWKWTVGASPRGNGHYAYAVITEHGLLVAQGVELEICQMIVEDHNKRDNLLWVDDEYLKKVAEEKGVQFKIEDGKYLVGWELDGKIEFEDAYNVHQCLSDINLSHAMRS